MVGVDHIAAVLSLLTENYGDWFGVLLSSKLPEVLEKRAFRTSQNDLLVVR